MILEIAQNFPIQTFNCHCYALKTGLKYITYHVPITFAVKNDVSVLFERCTVNQGGSGLTGMKFSPRLSPTPSVQILGPVPGCRYQF